MRTALVSARTRLAYRPRCGVRLLWVSYVAATVGSLCVGHTLRAAGVDIQPDVVNEQLNLAASRIVTLDLGVSATASDVLVASVPIDGVPSTISLRPHSVRAPGYTVKAQLADGSYVDVAPTPEQDYRGTVDGIGGSVVAASIADDGIRMRIIMPDASERWIEPASSVVAGAGANQYVYYTNADVLDTQQTCVLVDNGATTKHAHAPHALRSNAMADSVGAVAGGLGPFIAELAADADFEYFLRYGSVSGVEAQINSIINAVNVQYERDLNIQHVITTIIVRTAEPDPYSSSDASTLLTQFRSHWSISQGAVQRDMAQLFTGKALNDTVIGVAWQGTGGTPTVCGSFGYSVVESDCFFSCNNFAAKTDLSAHELGHNWGADHCACGNPGNTWTMNATITSANRFHPTSSIPEMEAFRDTRTCISQEDELRRIFITADAGEVGENGALQLHVTADFRFGADQDVTPFVTWGLDRPVGFVNALGVLTTFEVTGDLCLTLTASYTFNGIMKTDQILVRVIDFDAPLHISLANPPDGAIDARQPSDPQALAAMGWDSLDITLNGEVCSASPGDFDVTELNGGPPVPSVVSVEQLSINSFRLTLDPKIEPGAWTTVTHLPSGSSTTLGFLPGDVNGDARSDANDITALTDALNGAGPALPDWSTDLDRSGATTPADLITLIDMLNGRAAFIMWNGATLP